MKVASLAALSLLVAVTQGVQSNPDSRSGLLGGIQRASAVENAPQLPRNFPGSAFALPAVDRLRGLSTPVEKVKTASQGKLRRGQSVEPTFSPNLPEIFYTVPTFSTGGIASEAIATGDLNGDGKLDVVVGNQCSDSTCATGSVTVLLGIGDGTFQPAVSYNTPPTIFSVAIADLNGDGKLDIVAGRYCTSHCATLTVLLGNGDGTFQPGVGYTAGDHAVYIAIGDLNGDGKPDIVTNGCNENSCVSVLLGNGDGTFQQAVTYGSGGTFASSVAIGDLNADGKPDLVVMNSCPLGSCSFEGEPSVVGVLLGNGDGTFQAATTYNSGGYGGYSAAVADVNGDGKLDIVAASLCVGSTCGIFGGFGTSGVGVLLGNGDGTFQAATTYNSGGNQAVFVMVVDVNRDGKVDLVVGNNALISDNFSSSNVAVLLGNGDGTFLPAVNYDSGGPAASVYSMAAGDVNADGKTDLLVVNDCVGTNCDGDGVVGLLLGNGNGTFPSAASYEIDGWQTNALAVADLNGDGNPDIVSANQCFPDTDCSNVGVAVSLGNADGTFQVGILYGSGGYDPLSVAIADVNGDGQPDIVVANRCSARNFCSISTIGVLLGNGDGTFRAAIIFRSTNVSPVSVAIADLNGDGKPDIAVAYLSTIQNGGALGVLLGKGDGTFGPIVQFGSGGFLASAVAIADVNGDGKPDILAANGCATATCGSGSVGVLLGNGDGTFQLAVAYNSGSSYASAVVVGDVNADGKPDLVIGGSAIEVLLGNGDGTFRSAQSATSAPPVLGFFEYASGQIALADFDGDGKLDVAVGSARTLQLGNGDGTFQPPIQIPGEGFGTAVGDFNHDGKPDLVVNGITVLLNISGVSATAVVSPTSVNFGNQAVGIASSSQQVTLSNTGTAALNLSSISVGVNNGSVTETNNCGTSVGAGASCAVTLSWTPSATGNMTGSLTFTDNAGNSPQTVSLSGVGVSPSVTLSPVKLIFNTQVVFTTSPSQTATLTNIGLGILSIAKIGVSGPFLETNNCGKSVAAGASCTFTVTFKPTTIGTLTGAISITDNAGNSPQSLALTGFGTYVGLTPTSLTFGNQTVGSKSLPKRVTLSNKGSVAVSITGISFTGTNATDFTETNTCGTSVAAGGSCFITVTFTPSAKGNRTATLSVTDNGGASPQKVSVAGTGT